MGRYISALFTAGVPAASMLTSVGALAAVCAVATVATPRLPDNPGNLSRSHHTQLLPIFACFGHLISREELLMAQ